ncbi:tRNA (adenosine(37)-N6)-threonylcarbamoyltransferase complex dimerization subunit type 1 TsaB [Herbivorax sp. ANBcel31]|uniref:tRNA (adenosine(37)-N6)-threonylcarbamoyltransferase complex dimerization subunit type 1 TsaB n=1 Tax=Herbivorax sp. ANBcel31 TaxID=3069754 RepID=UPI0027AF955D|nr:tRNA (adenosine(37)-N6)-threonylcarbamoyltransferase complex dimerization subunit type 1 TsaB [Herbivorax sp. ANBcel31]MDQ2086215.1 tRNA (adenosine(37)-N6)-threonylcarbamoyltransferase complex dimerization subunit type 1 TsaB [Herbivorax sp. ANBcel31]
MKILAVDTSTLVAAVSVMEDERLLGEYIVNHKKTHSQRLMPMIKGLLDELELKPTDIDIFAASTGPGSFTGLRIGVTTIKTMAYAVSKSLVGVPTLDSLAYNILMRSFIICPIMDARNNQVYTALYEWNDDRQERISDYLALPVDELADIIEKKDKKVVFVGDGVDIHKDFFKKRLKDNCEFALGNMRLQRASAVAGIAYLKAKEGNIESSFEMVPFYLRKSQAERMYEKKLSVNDDS